MDDIKRQEDPPQTGRINDTETELLRSHPNIFSNYQYNDLQSSTCSEMQQEFQFGAGEGNARLQRITSSPPVTSKAGHSRSPKFCGTLERHAFMRNVINSKSKTGDSDLRYQSPSEKEAHVRRSLEEISKDIKEIEDFITATEFVMRREKERDSETKRRRCKDGPNKENKTPSPIKLAHASGSKSPMVTYKINSFKVRRSKPTSPRFCSSKLYFRNGRIGCLEAEKQISNIESTHAIVKHILKYENEKPLVSPDCVRRVLNGVTTDSIAASPVPSLLPSPTSLQDSSPLVSPSASASSGLWQSSSSRPIQLAGDVDVQLPGAVVNDGEAAVRVKLTGSDAGTKSDSVNMDSEATFDSQSQVLRDDEDEHDVQICYDESPELPNEEHNIVPILESRVMESEVAIVHAEDETGRQNVDRAPVNVSSNHLSSTGSLDSEGQQFLRDQVRHLVRRFTARANKAKSRIEMPPTPSSTASSPSPPPSAPTSASRVMAAGTDTTTHNPTQPPMKQTRAHKIKIMPKEAQNRGRLFEADTPRSNVWLCSSLCGSNNDERTLDPQGKIYISWLCVVSLSFLYNAWVIPLRAAFPFQTPQNTNTWLVCDFCADIIYLLDVVFFKHRIMYLFEGFWVKNKNLTRKNYMRKLQFKLDLLALLPLELLYFKFGTKAVWLRFPRLFKIQSFWEVFKLLDRVIAAPHFVRVTKTLTYMLYMIHLTSACYYAYSDFQGLGVNRWVFSGKGHPYVRCFAFATKTATSIGKNPKPEREGEFVFMTAAWLMGVFVFALLIGQIRDIISTATRNKNEYRQLEDETLEYMRRLNLPKNVQRRVKMWFKFTWDQQRTLDEGNILDSLPINLKTDIAISVHIQTLSKVQLFADCEEALLRDLVLKLRAVTFLPGDYVCRKGEVGREMYIIKLGQVQVMGGPNNDVVLATLSEGSVFGEISLLGINGADRRTADVRSKGYANLFVLSKSDLNEVIAYYPNAQAILKKRARTLMRKNAAREREEARAKSAYQADVVIGNPKTPESAPKLLHTVIQALPYESPAVILITRGSKRFRKKRPSLQMDTIDDKEFEETTATDSIGADDGVRLKRTHSPDLLSSIQKELKNKHKFINLTDSEKALIVNTSSNSSIEHQPKSKDEEVDLRE